MAVHETAAIESEQTKKGRRLAFEVAAGGIGFHAVQSGRNPSIPTPETRHEAKTTTKGTFKTNPIPSREPPPVRVKHRFYWWLLDSTAFPQRPLGSTGFTNTGFLLGL